MNLILKIHHFLMTTFDYSQCTGSYSHLLYLYRGNINGALLCLSSQLCVQSCHVDGLKSAMVGVFALWKSTNTANQQPNSRAKLFNLYRYTSDSLYSQ